MDQTDWHIFLAVARHGSTLAASRHLKVSQSSVSRRIDALERALGLKLFDRTSAGYRITGAGEAMLPKANAIAFAIQDAMVTAAQQVRGLSRRIRFTTLEAFAQTFAVSAIREFREGHPEINIDLMATELPVDLAAGEADIALRAGPAPTGSGLVIRKVIEDGWSVYCSQSYAERQGTPTCAEDLASHNVIALPRGFRGAPIADWQDRTVPESAVVLRSDGVPGLLAGLKSGSGVALMSDMVAETDATLIRCFVPPVTLVVPVWLVTTERLRDEPRIRALMEFLAAYIKTRCFREGPRRSS